MKCLFMGALAGATALAVYAQRPAPDPRAFVVGMYAQYTDDSAPDESKFYSAGLLSLMAEDQKKAGEGYIGAIDSVQICQCQDWEGLKVVSLHLIRRTTTRTDADVVLKLLKDDPKLTRLRLKLLLSSEGWRVDDVQPAKGWSTRHLLKAAKYD